MTSFGVASAHERKVERLAQVALGCRDRQIVGGVWGRLSRSNDVGAASVNPGTVDIELASASDTTNRVAHLGHFRRLPAAMCGGQVQDDAASLALKRPRHEF